MTQQDLPNAGFFRRLAALFYDTLMVIAIEMIAAGVLVAILQALQAAGIFNVAPYLDISDFLTRHPIFSPLFSLYLLAVWIYFFVFFWTRAGQTLGMRAWKLQVRQLDNSPITKRQALIRLATSLFGLGNVMALVDSKKRGWQDYFAKTQVVVLAKAE